MEKQTRRSARSDEDGRHSGAKDDADENGRPAMLRMARSWEAAGQQNQAISLYHQLLLEHPHSTEALVAAQELLQMARDYEQQGKFHMALSLYDMVDHFQ